MYSTTLFSTLLAFSTVFGVDGAGSDPATGSIFKGYLQSTSPSETVYFLANFLDSAGLPALTQNTSEALFPNGLDQNVTFGRILSTLTSNPGDFSIANTTAVGVNNQAVVSITGEGQQNPVWQILSDGNITIWYSNSSGGQIQADLCTVVDPSTSTAHLRITNHDVEPSTAKCDGEPTTFSFKFTEERRAAN